MNYFDVAALNAYCLYNINHRENKSVTNARRCFLKKLEMLLAKPLIRHRIQRGFCGVHRSIQNAILIVIDTSPPSAQETPAAQAKRGRCKPTGQKTSRQMRHMWIFVLWGTLKKICTNNAPKL